MGVNKIAIGISIGILMLVGLVYFVGKKEGENSLTTSSSVKIEHTWDLPEILSEVSAIAFLGENKIVAVQDEQGKLFIYNLDSSKIETEINFADTGDYEGLALDGSTAYVLRSDGTLFKIVQFRGDAKVTEISTGLTEKEDTEGLCLDKKNNRLLIAIKDNDPSGGATKGIYAVSLVTESLQQEPVYEIDLKDSIFGHPDEDKLQDVIKPSEINIHPDTGEIFVLEGQEPKLLILDSQGAPVDFFPLEKQIFPQPEGLTFDAAGNLYISNEGKPATIYRVSLTRS